MNPANDARSRLEELYIAEHLNFFEPVKRAN